MSASCGWYPSSPEHLCCVSFPVSFACCSLRCLRHRICLSSFPVASSAGSGEKLSPNRDGERQWIKGKVPEEEAILPGRPQGSRNLPWDKFSIPTKTVRVPGVGDWGGELVSAKAAGTGFRHDATTKTIAGNLNVRRSCIAGRQPSGSGNVAPALKDAGSMPRRSGSDGSGRAWGRTCRRKAKPQRPPPPSLRVVTQQKNIPRFFAIVPAAMSRCGNPRVRPPRTVATTAVRPCSGCGTANASGCCAIAPRATSNAASNTKPHASNVVADAPAPKAPRPRVLRSRRGDCRLRS